MRKSIVVILMVGLFALCAQATPTLTLIPSSGTVSGHPGDTVGWGFTITNDSTTEWLVLSASEFDQTGGLPFQGTYTDYIVSGPLVVVGPAPESSTATQTFDAGLMTGTGEFDIASFASSGAVTGNLVLSYDLFTQNPLGLSFDPGSYVSSSTISAAAGVNVVTPEPGSAVMMLAGMPLLVGSLRRRLFR